MPSVNYRRLGSSGLKVSPLCLGAMNFGNDEFGCDESTSLEIIGSYLDAELRGRQLKSLMTLQIHDELIFECPADELEEVRALCLDIMPKSIEMAVPLKIDTKSGVNWGDMEYGDPVDVTAFA